MFDHADPTQERIHLSDTLKALAGRFREQAVTVSDVMKELGPNAAALLSVLITLPFCSPVTIPGTSTPSGLVVAFLAARFALGLPPWLPKRLLLYTLPPKFFALVFEYAGKLIAWLERVIRPRWGWVLGGRSLQRVHACLVVMAGLVLALPLPPFPPLSNTLPAFAVILTLLGLLEKDGRAVLAGWAVFIFTLLYFATAILMGKELLEWLHRWWTSL